MSKIIYIAGLGHSGSTILDMALGTLPNVVGLGELKTLLDEESRDRHYSSTCSCGKPATECEFWKDLPALFGQEHELIRKYDITLKHLVDKFGKEVCLVDSSKNSYSYLQQLNKNHELKVLYLTRDIRSWAYARYLSTGKPILYYFSRWLLENIKVYRRIKRMGIQVLRIGYEELSLYPEHVFNMITEFTGFEYSESLLSPRKTKSHIISGNVARADEKKRHRWIYDARWMLSKRILLYGPLLILFQSMNKRFVYSNISGGSLKDFHIFGSRRKSEISKSFN